MSTESQNQPKFILLNDRKRTWTTALRIAASYFTFGILWILGSDNLVQFLFTDPHLIATISLYKGFLFVIISSCIIYALIAPVLQRLGDKDQVVLESRNEMRILLYQDILTGLANRRKLMERLPAFLNDSTNRDKALIYIDVDNIKFINDSLGHDYGDMLIAGIAQRLSSLLMPPDELFRLGGDEFIILTTFSSMKEISAKSGSILTLFDESIPVENTSFHVTISVGISLYPLHSQNPGELLKFADMAMYQAKEDGKNRVRMFNSEMTARTNERLNIGEFLHDALLKQELEVYFQPQFSVTTRKITGFEALLRWTNPVLGFVSPDKFISVAEETHMIIPIGDWVLSSACAFIKQLHDEGFTDLDVSVNMSIIQLLRNDLVPKVKQVLAETALPPSALKLEVTESILMESFKVIAKQLETVRALGVGIALDDFGKGYSSLSYLEKLPISILKIDKIFINGIHEVNQDSSITGNIVRIGKKLGLTVVAEGVENETQLEYLTLQQCDTIQGWIFSKALPKDQALEFTRKINNLESRR